MTIKVANAPCSWGILEYEGMGDSLGYATVLDEMAEAGYKGTELGDWGFMPTDPELLSAELNMRGLAMLGAFVPVRLADPDALEDGLKEALKVAHLLAAVGDKPRIVLSDDNASESHRRRFAGRIRPEHGLNRDELTNFAQRADFVARQVFEETGLLTVFHHHCAGFIETPDEVSAFLDNTSSEVVGLCLDTGHFHYGGGDARAALSWYGERVWHVHFKDCHHQIAARARRDEVDYFEAVRRGVFCELGHGEVDFSGIVADLKGQKYEGWIVVEQDVLPDMGAPFQSAQRNRVFLRELGL